MSSNTLSPEMQNGTSPPSRKHDSNIAITVQDLAKSYTIQHQERATSLTEATLSRLKNPVQKMETETFWALNGVTFDVQRGEVVGIIGRNGAGKSTLLKVLSRITEPTHGRAVMHGRVGSLLEVGTGFHPELTGRENVFLNGAVLGMERKEVTRQFDAIVDFSGTEKFLDTPVKRYSSGMYVRLAFAVAAHLNPEILIVDEVLAVGDGEFQKKCLGKMQDVADEGRTVLFVSHNATAVRTLCNKVLWLDKGKTVSYGDTGPILNRYLHAGNAGDTKRIWRDPATAPKGEDVILTEASVYSETGESNLTVAMPITLSFSYTNSRPSHLLNMSVVLYNEEGVCIFNCASAPDHMPAGKIQSRIQIPANFLNDGVYFVRLLIVQDANRALLEIEDMLKFEVHDVERKYGWHGKWPGAVRPEFPWDTTINENIEGG